MVHERIVFAFCLAFLVFFSAVSHGASYEVPRGSWEVPLQELEGFANGTTGGAGGRRALVTSTADYAKGEKVVAGSLRDIVENTSAGKLWIRFSLPVGSKITLVRPLMLRSNLTIDGQNKSINITNRINWSQFELDPEKTVGRRQCRRVNHRQPMGTLFIINRSSNIILNGLNFSRANFNGSPWEESIPDLDKECLGDLISIYNDKINRAEYVDRIWINRSSFTQCGDGCIDITRPVSKPASISITNNIFTNTDKTMIVGTPYGADDSLFQEWGGSNDVSYPYRVSVLGNKFVNSNERNPRVSNAIAHIKNNTYINWGGYVVYAENALVLYEANKHRNGKSKAVISPASKGVILLKGNTDVNGKPMVELGDSSDFSPWTRVVDQ